MILSQRVDAGSDGHRSEKPGDTQRGHGMNELAQEILLGCRWLGG
jgi:hypothetical protein